LKSELICNPPLLRGIAQTKGKRGKNEHLGPIRSATPSRTILSNHSELSQFKSKAQRFQKDFPKREEEVWNARVQFPASLLRDEHYQSTGTRYIRRNRRCDNKEKKQPVTAKARD